MEACRGCIPKASALGFFSRVSCPELVGGWWKMQESISAEVPMKSPIGFSA